MPSPARFRGGFNNSTSKTGIIGRFFGGPDPTRYHQFFDDFDSYDPTHWVITTTEAGAGDATEAVIDADGGILVLTNDAADDDRDFLQWSGVDGAGTRECWTFVAGKQLWFQARFKVSDATQSEFVMGLQITDTTPLAVSDGVYWRKDDGDANLDFVVIASSSTTTATAASTCADDTYMRLSFYYDGKSSISYTKDGVPLGSSVITNMPSTELTISFGIQNGEAVAKTMSIDYIFVAKER